MTPPTDPSPPADEPFAPGPRLDRPVGPSAQPGQVDLTATFGVHRGTVSGFDDHVGAGTVTDRDGRSWSFHCTAIADGSRTIAAGTDVAFSVAPGPNGLEATGVTPS